MIKIKIEKLNNIYIIYIILYFNTLSFILEIEKLINIYSNIYQLHSNYYFYYVFKLCSLLLGFYKLEKIVLKIKIK
jgi:hypothetical protein